MTGGNDLAFEFENNSPIYVQLVNMIKISIISGELKPSERLPSVREFALKMRVNPNTMQKALGELEEAGLIYTERTNGKFVTEDTALINKLKQEYAKSLTNRFFAEMGKIGMDKEYTLKYIESFGENEK